MSTNNDQNQGVAGVAKGVTSTFGNLLGGATRTAGSVVGAVGRGIGDTIDSTTGTQAVGGGLRTVTGSVESGAAGVGKAVEDAGQWKTS